jgi:flagellar biosynthesis chaperone FliJ
MDVTRVKLRSGKSVRIVNEDLPALEEDQNKTDADIKNAPDASKLKELMDQLAALSPQLEALEKERDTLVGQLQAIKEQLDAAMNPDNVEAAATALNEERDEAAKVMNAHGLQLDDAARKLRGNDLRGHVVNAVRVKNGRPALDAETLKAEAHVAGMFAVYRETTPAAPSKPAGHQIVNASPTGATPDLSTNAGRAARAYAGAQK